MYTSSAAVLGVNFQSRSICPQKASLEKHRFLVGTSSFHDENELSVLEYREDSNSMEVSAVYAHRDQIWALEPSPTDPSLVISSRQAITGTRAITLWQMPNQNVRKYIQKVTSLASGREGGRKVMMRGGGGNYDVNDEFQI